MMHGRASWRAWVFIFIAYVEPTLQCGGGSPPDMGPLTEAQKESRMQELRLWCTDNCVTEWSPWSPCTKPCAGGNQSRQREQSAHQWCQQVMVGCLKSKEETKPCNEQCPFGVPVSKECHCMRGRTGTCCEKEMFCEYPGRPSNGKVSGQSWPATVGGVATFSCEPGYQMMGDDMRICEDKGSGACNWSGQNPECNQIACVSPQSPQDGRILNPNEGFIFGDMVLFACTDGYQLVGPDSQECRAFNETGGRWTAFTPRCEPISCPDPGIPVNGKRLDDGSNLKFKSEVQFECNKGYRLVGSTTLRCLASKSWFGHFPICAEVKCEPPFVPEHGSVRVRKHASGTTAIFTCDAGFRLDGKEIITCQGDGYWNDMEPKCASVDCGDPGTPKNGFKDGSIYTYPASVAYSCHRGYTLVGSQKITCNDQGSWENKGAGTQCEACPLNTWGDAAGNCINCPENSHTSSTANIDRKHCVCNNGYTWDETINPEGQCLKVECIEQAAPSNGKIINCEIYVGSKCEFGCNDGFVAGRSQGQMVLTCLDNGAWSGDKVNCEPCKMNTYKESDIGCLSCPQYSQTDGDGKMKKDCKCQAGFEGPGGGPCVDIDECIVNDGRGPCEETCVNYIGSYECRCARPGYKLDTDKHSCFPEKMCKKLGSDDAPINGALVCHEYIEQSSHYCSARCNYGYEHPDRCNDYETCGPISDFQWSFRINDPEGVMPACIPAFQPDFHVDADIFYLTKNCEDMNEEEKAVVRKEFTDMLNDQNICSQGKTQVCDIEKTELICGKTDVQLLRTPSGGVQLTTMQDVHLGVDIKARVIIKEKKDCNETVCKFLRIPDRDCARVCHTAYLRYIKASVMYAERQLKKLYGNPNKLTSLSMNVANRRFQPKSPGQNLATSGLNLQCEDGMEADSKAGSCRPCEAGTFLLARSKRCEVCPAGSYQQHERQNTCKPCPIGTYNTKRASLNCIPCEQGLWGKACRQKCNCKNGMCNPFDGSCTCYSGWEGEYCDRDVNGCLFSPCFPGVNCTDVHAPHTGFTCNSCPTGFDGNGGQCSQSGVTVKWQTSANMYF